MKKLLILLLFAAPLYGSGIYNPGSTGGGGGSGGYAMQPATVTIVAALGVTLPDNISVSSGAINLSQLANVASGNAIINGNMQFWQRGTSFAFDGAGLYFLDRWRETSINSTATCFVVQVSTVTHLAQFAMQFSVTFNNGSGDQQYMRQQVENYYDYAGSSVTLSVWVNSNAATTVAIKDSAGTTSSSAHAADSAWHQLTVTRFLASGITSLEVQLGNQIHPGAGTVQYYDGVMLVPGDTPVNYVARPLPAEFAMCQRYYFKTFAPATVPAQNLGSSLGALTYSVVIAGVTQNSTALPFPVQMRVAPTVTFYSIGAASTAWWNISSGAASGASSIPGTGPSTRNTDARNAQAVTDAAGNLVGIHLTADAEM